MRNPPSCNDLPSGAVRRCQGKLSRDAKAPGKERPGITPRLIADLVRYSQERLAAGDGVDLLAVHEATDAELVGVLGLGYLPAEFSAALPKEDAKALRGRLKTPALVVPAFDEQGQPVDVLLVRPLETHPLHLHLLKEPAGLIAPRVATSFPEIIVCDSFRVFAKLWLLGIRNAMLLRGERDVALNAGRLRASGVRKATVLFRSTNAASRAVQSLTQVGIESKAIGLPKCLDALNAEWAQHLQGEGRVAQAPVTKVARPEAPKAPVPEIEATNPSAPISVVEAAPEAPSPSKPSETSTGITLASFDAKSETAHFQVGDAKYAVEVQADAGSRMQVRLERGSQVALSRFDLAVEPQRRRFAASAAMKTGLAIEIIDDHLIGILDAVNKLREEALDPIRTPKARIEVSAEERQDALKSLRSPKLLDDLAADLETLGWPGDLDAKKALLLSVIGRKLPRPVSAFIQAGEGDDAGTVLDLLASLTPPEDILHVARLTDAALYYQQPGALKNKLVMLDDTTAITEPALVALKVLQGRGALSQTYSFRDPASGETVTRVVEAEGPVTVLGTASAKLNATTLRNAFEVTLDDSNEQVERILNAQRALRSEHAHEKLRSEIVKRHRTLQRLIEALPVTIPFAGRVQLPAVSPRSRAVLDALLGLTEASALLHQHSRQRVDGAIVAAEADFEIARKIANAFLVPSSGELGRNARAVLEVLQGEKLTRFTTGELHRRRPSWKRYVVRAGIDELLAVEAVRCVDPRAKPKLFELLAKEAEHLKKPESIGALAKIGETRFANITPARATG